MKRMVRVFLFWGLIFNLCACGNIGEDSVIIDESNLGNNKEIIEDSNTFEGGDNKILDKSNSSNDKGEINNPYSLGESFEITAYDIVPYSAYTPTGRQVENPIKLRISNIQVLEQQKYSSYEDDKYVEYDNYYLVAFDLEVLESSLSDTVTLSLNYLHLYNLNTNGQQGNMVLSFEAEIPDDYIQFYFQTVMPIDGAMWKFADVIQTEDRKDLAYIIFNYCGEDGEFHNIYVKYDVEKEAVPNEELGNNSVEKDDKAKYEAALACMYNEDWKSAKEILGSISSDYQDLQKASSYVKGMIYSESNVYGSAIGAFGNASNYKDADKQREDLLELVAEYEGTWYYDNPQYPGKGLGYYMFIREGMVAFEYESSLNHGATIYYHNSLAMKHNNENSLDEIFVVSSSAGLFEDIEDEDYDYLIIQLPDGGLTVSGRHLDGTDYFTGIYDKISNEVPKDNTQEDENNLTNILNGDYIAGLLTEYPNYVNELADYVSSIHKADFLNGKSFADLADYEDYFADFFAWADEIINFNGEVENDYQELWKEFQELIAYHVEILNESYEKDNIESLNLIKHLMDYISEKSNLISDIM